MQHRDLLLTFASVAATFIGFAGVVFAVRASDSGVTRSERTALIHLLNPSIAALVLAFLPLVAFAAHMSEPRIWWLGNIVLGVTHTVLIGSAVRAAIRGHLIDSIGMRFVLIPGGCSAVAANVIVSVGFVPELAAGAYLAGLLWFLFVSAVQFATLIFLVHAR